MVDRLTVHPAAATQPSEYRLLPGLAELTPGNAVPLYLMVQIVFPDDKTTEEVLYPENHKYDWLDTPIDQFPAKYTQRLLDEYADALAYGDLAARRRDVVWDVGWRERAASGTKYMAYLNGMHHLAIVTAFRARWQVSRKDWPSAAYSLQTTLAMSRQVAREPAQLHARISEVIAEIAINDGAEEWVSRAGSPNLYWALSQLPHPWLEPRAPGQDESYDWELKYTNPLVYSAIEGDLPPEQWPRRIRQMVGMGEDETAPYTRSAARIEDLSRQLIESAYPRAVAYLVSHGTPRAKTDAMSKEQAVGTYLCREYRSARDELCKALILPFPQLQDQMLSTWREIAPDKQPLSENPLVDALLVYHQIEEVMGPRRPAYAAPTLLRMRYDLLRPDREIAMFRTIEALRDYAAHHDGRPPERLDQVTELLLPTDPITGEPFEYELHGNVATLKPHVPPFYRVARNVELTFEP